MDFGKKVLRLLVWLGVVLLQLIMTQVVTFVISLLVPGIGDYRQTDPALFVAILGVTFTTGVYLAGWVALKRRWLRAKPMFPVRLAGALVAAYLPLFMALILYRALEPGNPFFFLSMMASVLGFHVPGWVGKSYFDGDTRPADD